jgi:hypothetical protein
MKNPYLLAAMVALSGCAATPSLEYRTPGPDRDGFMKFTLPQSSVVLANQPGGITAIAVPDDDYEGAESHSLMADAQWSVWTSSTITKWEFTDGQNVVKAIATSAESNVAKIINLAADAGAFAASTAAGMAFNNDIIDPFTDHLGNARALPIGSTVDCKLRHNPGWACSIAIGRHPAWVIPYAEFRDLALNGDARKMFPSSACVPARIRLLAPANMTQSDAGLPAKPGDEAATTVTVRPDGTLSRVGAGQVKARPDHATQPAATAPRQELTFSVELADPAFVNLTRLRSGGELQASGPCRFNVTNDKAGSNFDTDAFKSALALAKSLKAAHRKP